MTTPPKSKFYTLDSWGIDSIPHGIRYRLHLNPGTLEVEVTWEFWKTLNEIKRRAYLKAKVLAYLKEQNDEH